MNPTSRRKWWHRAALSLVPFLPFLSIAESSAQVWPPTCAGEYYPRTPQKLAQSVDNLLKAAQSPMVSQRSAWLAPQNPPIGRKVIALIAPHAAYKYSGTAAAHAFRPLSGQRYKRVFILAPWHGGKLATCALPSATGMQTPLGPVPIDTATIARLKAIPWFPTADQCFGKEYSIETVLPLLQRTVGNVPIVPILVGQEVSADGIKQIAAALRPLISADDLVVASSDFTVIGSKSSPIAVPRDQVIALDRNVYSGIARMNSDQFRQTLKQSSGHVCGANAISVLLSMLPQGTQPTLMDYYSSHDLPANKLPKLKRYRTVSYFAVDFCGGNW